LIYEFPSAQTPIRQGDVFYPIPRIEMSLSELPVINEAGVVEVRRWNDISAMGKPVVASLGVRPTVGIVISQNCDAVRADDIALAEIRDFTDVERKSKQTASAKAWVSIITQHARLNLKWFYLPPDNRMGFHQKMGVDFLTILRVARIDLENMRAARLGRLNDLATEHFRERLSDFFRRYAYDEWYPLNGDEYAEYKREYHEAKPFDWQASQSIAPNLPPSTE